MIRFACPGCSAVLAVPDKAIGKKGRCPKCAQRLQIPSPPSSPRDRTVLGINAAAESGAGSDFPISSVEKDWRQANADASPSEASPDWMDSDDGPAKMPQGTKIAIIALGAGVLAIVFVAIMVFIKAKERRQVAEQPAPKQRVSSSSHNTKPVEPRALDVPLERGVRPDREVPLEDRVPLEVDDRPFPSWLGVLSLIALLLFLGVLFQILTLVWVARDAKYRGLEGAVWVIVVFFLGFLGLIVYLLARPGGMLTRCNWCHNRKLNYARICPHCGHTEE